MRLKRLDHLVLTVADTGRTVAFYRDALGMEPVIAADGQQALRFGDQKINLHGHDQTGRLVARQPTPGSADLCFLVDAPIEDIVARLADRGVAVESDIVERSGATGPIRSVYLRDPDGNLIELSNPIIHLPTPQDRSQ